MHTARGECDGHGAVDTAQPNDEGARLNTNGRSKQTKKQMDAVRPVRNGGARVDKERARRERGRGTVCPAVCVCYVERLGTTISLPVLKLHLG